MDSKSNYTRNNLSQPGAQTPSNKSERELKSKPKPGQPGYRTSGRRQRLSSTTSSLYVKNTLYNPNVKSVIQAVAVVIQSQIASVSLALPAPLTYPTLTQ